MDVSSVSKTTNAVRIRSSSNPAVGGDPLSNDERKLVGMYRSISSRWEKDALFLLMQSLAWGRLIPDATDHYTRGQMRKHLELDELPKAGRAGVNHG